MADLSGQSDWLVFPYIPCHLDLVAQVRDIGLVWELVGLVKAYFKTMIQLSLDPYYLL